MLSLNDHGKILLDRSVELQDMNEIRTADRSCTLLDFVLDALPAPFYNELTEIEHAAALSWDDMSSGLSKLYKGYNECETELGLVQSGQCPGDAVVLAEFVEQAKSTVDGQKQHMFDAKEKFRLCANSFGEDAKNSKDLPRFFGIIVGLIQYCKAYEQTKLRAKPTIQKANKFTNPLANQFAGQHAKH